jgi:hypothetical protein
MYRINTHTLFLPASQIFARWGPAGSAGAVKGADKGPVRAGSRRERRFPTWRDGAGWRREREPAQIWIRIRIRGARAHRGDGDVGMGQYARQQVGSSSQMFTAAKHSYRNARGHKGGEAGYELGKGDTRAKTTET